MNIFDAALKELENPSPPKKRIHESMPTSSGDYLVALKDPQMEVELLEMAHRLSKSKTEREAAYGRALVAFIPPFIKFMQGEIERDDKFSMGSAIYGLLGSMCRFITMNMAYTLKKDASYDTAIRKLMDIIEIELKNPESLVNNMRKNRID